MYSYLLEHDLAQSRMREEAAQIQAASRARRLYLARRAARRAERAVRRAAPASVTSARSLGASEAPAVAGR